MAVPKSGFLLGCPQSARNAYSGSAMLSEQQGIFDSLKDKGPEEWDAYLRPIEAERASASLSMQIAFDHAAKLAQDQSSLKWTEIALRAADLEKKSNVPGVSPALPGRQ
jgi:hypothetical protein